MLVNGCERKQVKHPPETYFMVVAIESEELGKEYNLLLSELALSDLEINVVRESRKHLVLSAKCPNESDRQAFDDHVGSSVAKYGTRLGQGKPETLFYIREHVTSSLKNFQFRSEKRNSSPSQPVVDKEKSH